MLDGLETLSAAAGVALTRKQADNMRSFWRLVLETNRHTNLTRITDDRDAVLKHFIDSLLVLKTGIVSSGARIVDIGTGAGFPGIPMKIARPDVNLTLIDATLKRVRFLHGVVDVFGWTDVIAVHGRAERLAPEPGYRERFDVAVARAVARLERLVPLCLPFVRAGGYFVAMKGPAVEAELLAADAVLRASGGTIAAIHRESLPEGAGERTLIVVEKVGGGQNRQESSGKLQKNEPIAADKTEAVKGTCD